jgi:hypothetical protein
MKALNIFLLIVLLALGGFIAFELMGDNQGSEDPQETNMQTDNQDQVENIDIEPVAQVEVSPYVDDIAAVKAFKVLIDSEDEAAIKEYIISLGEILPEERASEFNTKISELSDEDWQEYIAASKTLVETVSDDSNIFFKESEYAKELASDRYGDTPWVRYYQVVTEVRLDDEGDVVSERGILLVFSGEGTDARLVPPIAFHRLLK